MPFTRMCMLQRFQIISNGCKSVFLNGCINEEVYVSEPPDFENHEFLNHVFKQKRDLYGFKQAPRAWYEQLI